jgi:DNA-binding transcriptional ArsR family regulator
MYLLNQKTSYNPLHEILVMIPSEGIKLTHSFLSAVGNLLNRAGIVCTEFEDVIQIFKFLEELQVVRLEKKWTTLTLYKVDYGNQIKQ